MKRKNIPLVSILMCIFAIACCVNHASAIQIDTFAEGFTNPTGLAINTNTRELYVNSGINGNLWSVPINDDGSAGGIKLVTSSFAPNYDIELDAEMNIYGLKHGDPYIYRLSDTGQVSKNKQDSYNQHGTGIAIEPPGMPSNTIIASRLNGDLAFKYISSYMPDGGSLNYRYAKSCGSFRFMQWRRDLNEILGTSGETAVSINPSDGSCNILASGMISPAGISQDHKGNIYIADTGAGTITKITSLGKTSVIVTGLQSPMGLAYDSETNRLFVSENAAEIVSSIDMGAEDMCPEKTIFAQNPITRQWAAFPTVCDVPLRWEMSETPPEWFGTDSPSTSCEDEFNNGMQKCIDDPSSCGIETGAGSPITEGNCASFDLFTNLLHVPCLDMGAASYWLDLRLQGDTLEIKGYGEK